MPNDTSALTDLQRALTRRRVVRDLCSVPGVVSRDDAYRVPLEVGRVDAHREQRAVLCVLEGEAGGGAVEPYGEAFAWRDGERGVGVVCGG